MNTKDKVVVCSRSFSKNSSLRSELLSRYSQVTFNDNGLQLEGESLIKFLTGHDKAIIALEKIDDYTLASLPQLKVIGKYGVGLDMIDLKAMVRYQKRLGWTSGVNRRSASELTLAFIIMMLRFIPAANREVLSGVWRQHIGGLLSGRNVGIVGCGNIGKDLVKLLQPFGCSVIVYDICNYADFNKEYGVILTPLDELLAKADIVTLHLPLDDSTRNILNSERLGLMKQTAILINAARGGLVDELALKELLKTKKLAAAAFDVFLTEPPIDNELLCLPNFLATPHIGGSAEEAIIAMGIAAIDGLDANQVPDGKLWGN
jgi:phosphoglycerate dehydrogenase-like enzyme